MNIALDTTLAKAGSGESSRIDTTGKYKGTIEAAKTWLTDQGARMVSIRFVSDGGQEATIKLCTHNRQGEPVFGFNKLQAIMACCKTRQLTEDQVVMEDYNPHTRQLEPMERTVYKELTKAPIGFALYRHEQDKYSNPQQSTYTMDIAASFNYDSEQVASEILESAPAQRLEKVVVNLKDRDSRQHSLPGQSMPSYAPATPIQSDDFRDDIPF